MKILLADDHELVRQGLRKVLETRPEWQICGEASNGREAVAKAQELRPDLVILDFSMPEMTGVEATREIHLLLPKTEILMLTMHESDELAHEVLAAGAKGFILKTDAGRLLLQAIESLAAHRPFFTAKISELILYHYLYPDQPFPNQAAQPTLLTPREREIIKLIAEGKSSKEAARKLGIAVKTAETHRSNLMRKLELRSVSDLVRYAVRNHIVEA